MHVLLHAGSEPTRDRATGADVAREAGVSVATVSYVLNDAPGRTIPETTRQRVRQVAERLGYQPSPAGRQLRRGRSDLVLCILPDWPVRDAVGELLRRMTVGFARHRLTMVTYTGAEDPSGAVDVGVWRDLAPAAVLAFGPLAQGDAEHLRANGVRLTRVVQGEPVPGSGDAGSPERALGRMQAEHLIAGGHRRIGYAWPADERVIPFAEERLRGVQEALAKAGWAPARVLTVPFQVEPAAEAVRSWRSGRWPVTGVCAYDDDIALAILAGAARAGARVPADLAVIGADDLPTAVVAEPALTTIARDIDAFAHHFVQSVLAALKNQPTTAAAPAEVLRLVHRSTT